MNTKSAPSLYENCMPRLSTVAVSTFVPALKVLSTTLPERTCLSFVRTNAPPLPGLTCWNSTTDQSWPLSSLSTMPFFRSLVVATSVVSPACFWDRKIARRTGLCRVCHDSPLQDEQLLGRDGE